MPVWPKFAYTFHGSRQTAATQRKLRDERAGPAQQDEVFRSLIHPLSTTSFWKQYGVESGMSYSRFQARVPLQRYDQIAPAVTRMQRGESDVLWPGKCTLFGRTSGTTDFTPKCLPMTDALLAHFRRAGFEALLYYTARSGKSGIFRGRHLYYSASTALAPLPEAAPERAFAGQVSGIMALNLPRWAKRHLYEPGAAIAEAPSNDHQLEAIATRTAKRDITLIAGVPNSIPPLLAALRKRCFGERGSERAVQEHWRHLECFVHSGAGVSPHFRELRQALGDRVAFHEVFAASEGVLAAQDAEPGRGLRVLTDMGLFFEFVPLREFDDLRQEQLGAKALPLGGVKTGIDYVMIVTTPGGLVRYILGDIVRFISTTPPRLIYVGSTELRLNALGENVSERELTDVLVNLCQRREWTLVNFHVAPLFAAGILTGQQRGSHEWWIELKPGTVITPTGPQMGMELDAALRETNSTYAAKRAMGFIDAPIVRLVMPGVFEYWLRFHQRWGGQHKMPRCRSDRRVADEFALITNFAPD